MYVKDCVNCQQFKIRQSTIKLALMPLKGPELERPFVNISMNVITGLPPSNRFDLILSVVDHGLTKGIILIPCTTEFSFLDIAQALLNNVFKRFSLPDKIISDRGPKFASEFFKELLRLLEI